MDALDEAVKAAGRVEVVVITVEPSEEAVETIRTVDGVGGGCGDDGGGMGDSRNHGESRGSRGGG